MDEFVKIVLMASAKINERLDSLIRVGRNVLALSGTKDGEHVVGEGSEVCNGVVDIGGFVDAYEGFIEDGEEVTKEAKGDGFFDHRKHLGFIALPSVHLQKLLKVCEELGALLHLFVDL